MLILRTCYGLPLTIPLWDLAWFHYDVVHIAMLLLYIKQGHIYIVRWHILKWTSPPLVRQKGHANESTSEGSCFGYVLLNGFSSVKEARQNVLQTHDPASSEAVLVTVVELPEGPRSRSAWWGPRWPRWRTSGRRWWWWWVHHAGSCSPPPAGPGASPAGGTRPDCPAPMRAGAAAGQTWGTGLGLERRGRVKDW